MTPGDMDRLLAQIPGKAKAILRRAIKKGVDLLAKKIRDAAPKARKRYRYKGQLITPGRLKKSIKGRMNKAKYNFVSGKAGVQVASGAGMAPHGPLNALGTDLRYSGFKQHRSKGKYSETKRTAGKIAFRGKMTPNPFVKRTSQTAASDVFGVIVDTMRSGIEKEFNRQGF